MPEYQKKHQQTFPGAADGNQDCIRIITEVDAIEYRAAGSRQISMFNT